MNRRVILRIAAAAMLMACLLSGCSFSSTGKLEVFTNQDLDNPKQSILSFIDAMKAENFDADAAEEALSYIGNYSTMGFEKFSLVQNETVDRMLFDALRASYRVEFADNDLSPLRIPYKSEDMTIAGKQAFVTFDFTYLDFSLMSAALAERVAEVGAERMYDGVTYETQNAAMELVEEVYSTIFLQENKESDFYITRTISLELQFADGSWKLVLNEDFYDALLGR